MNIEDFAFAAKNSSKEATDLSDTEIKQIIAVYECLSAYFHNRNEKLIYAALYAEHEPFILEKCARGLFNDT